MTANQSQTAKALSQLDLVEATFEPQPEPIERPLATKADSYAISVAANLATTYTGKGCVMVNSCLVRRAGLKATYNLAAARLRHIAGTIPLAAPPEHAKPEMGNVVTEPCKSATIRRHCMIVEVAL